MDKGLQMWGATNEEEMPALHVEYYDSEYLCAYVICSAECAEWFDENAKLEEGYNDMPKDKYVDRIGSVLYGNWDITKKILFQRCRQEEFKVYMYDIELIKRKLCG